MEISTAGATHHPEAGRKQIALDERGRDASPDRCSESPIHSTSEERRPDYLVLMKTNLEDDLVWRTKELDGGVLAIPARVPCGAPL